MMFAFVMASPSPGGALHSPRTDSSRCAFESDILPLLRYSMPARAHTSCTISEPDHGRRCMLASFKASVAAPAFSSQLSRQPR